MYHFPEEIRKAYESQPIALVYDMLVDGKALPILVSDGFCELVGMNRENAMEWFKKGQFERIHPDDVGLVNHVSEIFANKESGYDIIFRTRHSDGYHVIHAVGKWQTMPDGTELALLTYADITENAEAVASTTEKYQLFKEDHFYTDSLTGLPNLNYLNKFADERLHAIRTEGNTPIIIYIDVIAMQYYNNHYGYQKGNDLLCLIRDLLNDKFPTALVCRGADDHFIVIDRYENNTVTEDILSSIGEMIRAKAYGRTSGIRCGVCIVEPDMNAAEAEDHAKSAIKWLGTDLSRTCHFYTHITQDILWNQRDIINHVDQALSEEWIKVYYQGIVNTKTGKGASLEALARWNDPKRGLLSPGEFIPVLDISDVIEMVIGVIEKDLGTHFIEAFFQPPFNLAPGIRLTPVPSYEPFCGSGQILFFIVFKLIIIRIKILKPEIILIRIVMFSVSVNISHVRIIIITDFIICLYIACKPVGSSIPVP